MSASPTKPYVLAGLALAVLAVVGYFIFNSGQPVEAPAATVAVETATPVQTAVKSAPAPSIQPYTGPADLVLPTGTAKVITNADGSKTVKYVSFNPSAKPWEKTVRATAKLTVEPITGVGKMDGKAITYIAVSESEIAEMTQTKLTVINSETGTSGDEFISNYDTADVSNPAYDTPRVQGSGILTVVDGKKSVVDVAEIK